MFNKFLVNVKRSNHVECIHRGSMVIFKNNEMVCDIGKPDNIVAWRSTAKPFMLFPLLNCEKKNFSLTDKELAIMVSSHNGEAIHREVIRGILSKANASEGDVFLGTHLPYFEWLYDEYFSEQDRQKKQLFHNCSGKHAAMILMCRMYDFPIGGYWERTHPLQELIKDYFKKFIEISQNDYMDIGLDGCGVPTFFTSLQKVAYAYQKFSNSESVAVLRNAILKESYMLAGRERIETDIINECGYIAKSGADGLFCVSIPSENMGIAIKIESGFDDAAEAAIVAILDRLDQLSYKQKNFLNKYQNLKIYTSTNIIAGNLEVIID